METSRSRTGSARALSIGAICSACSCVNGSRDSGGLHDTTSRG